MKVTKYGELTAFVRHSVTPQPTAVVVSLHGLGDVGTAFADIYNSYENSFAGEHKGKTTYVHLQGPIDNAGKGFRWFSINFMEVFTLRLAGRGLNMSVIPYPERDESLDSLLQAVKEIKEAFKVTEDRMILFGFSQGCCMSLLILMYAERQIKYSILVSGFLTHLTELTQHVQTRTKTDPEWAERFRDCKVLHSYGDTDPVIVINLSEQLATFLEQFDWNVSRVVENRQHLPEDDTVLSIITTLDSYVKEINAMEDSAPSE